MKSKGGAALRYEVEETASELAIKLYQIVKTYPVYKSIADRLQSSKTELYFQKRIKMEIYPVARDLCVLRWYKRNNRQIDIKDKFILIPKHEIYLLLSQVWIDSEFPVQFSRYITNNNNLFIPSLLQSFRSRGKGVLNVWNKWKYAGHFRGARSKKPVIALEYTEKLDLCRRSDLVWFPESGIDPKQVLIYFNGPDAFTGKPIADDDLRGIEALGMNWVCLKPGSLARKNIPIWRPAMRSKQKIARPINDVGKWIYKTGKELLEKVGYWASFYEEFNIKIHFINGEGDLKYIAQSIAFDMNGQDSGFLAGKQRSELYLSSRALLGHYPRDVFFTWSARSRDYLLPNLNRIKANVTVGYPNDSVFLNKQKIDEAKKLNDEIRAQGADFIVALFDNIHNSSLHISTEMMEKFYLAFFGWVLEDKSVGLVIKTKKPLVLETLPKVLPLLEKALATGRCVMLENAFGRLPVDAALAGDMSVGIGISSAVIEPVIAGGKGIHCDLTCLFSHEFYKWGNKRIIFDDTIGIINALKQYKTDKSSNPLLGDWAPFLDKLDPFRDGRAGERMGVYLRWLLEGFDEGLGRESVLRRASTKYAEKWGGENILELI
ncbi:hypothetical protein HZC34_07905 [Candidatus Saganbacteria bacterium]|nr:hypothetical protein [Candidatus Saganbacteria bacterium]